MTDSKNQNDSSEKSATDPQAKQLEPTRARIGDGLISGYIAIFLGIMGNLSCICFHYPEIFTTPEITEALSSEQLRMGLYVGLGIAYAFAFYLGDYLLELLAGERIRCLTADSRHQILHRS